VVVVVLRQICFPLSFRGRLPNKAAYSGPSTDSEARVYPQSSSCVLALSTGPFPDALRIVAVWPLVLRQVTRGRTRQELLMCQDQCSCRMFVGTSVLR
jgi:hypothetical protein